ncbi:MAG: DUF503 domain-containing protein [Negativicutes bacterium]|nr:DUF503 domain-containing protein [Negativicutes bacterium]
MPVVICELELFIPGANSLKAKRQVVKRVVERIRSRCHAAVAETGFQDTWQRAAVTAAMVGGSRKILDAQVNLMRNIVDDVGDAEVTLFDVEFL